MRWPLIALTVFLPLVAIQVADAQQPTCEVACAVNPFTAPPSCNCNGAGEQAEAPAPVDPAPQPAAPALPVVAQSAEPPAAAEPGVPTCELACQVNPFTAPAGCDCTAIWTTGGGGGATAGPGPSGPTAGSIWEDGLLSVGEILDHMEALYRERIAGVQSYYYLERMVVGQAQASLPQNQ